MQKILILSFIFTLNSFAYEVEQCLEIIKKYNIAHKSFPKVECNKGEYVFSGESRETIVCKFRGKEALPVKQENGGYELMIEEYEDGKALFINYDDQGHITQMRMYPNSDPDSFKQDFFAEALNMDVREDKCIATSGSNGIGDSNHSLNFSADACAAWESHLDEKNPKLYSCEKQFKEALAIYDEKLSNKPSWSNQSYVSNLNPIMAAVAKLEENCRHTYDKYGAGESVKLLKKDYLSKPDPIIKPTENNNDLPEAIPDGPRGKDFYPVP
jgi:hypothetical protein